MFLFFLLQLLAVRRRSDGDRDGLMVTLKRRPWFPGADLPHVHRLVSSYLGAAAGASRTHLRGLRLRPLPRG
ncbi:hypothetical protein EYF80_066961 [Liparis tanakae]|uniref:Secreted protein n=1 Tax=Liparis tanakae TaxID=230148 RepID=A0A4Z2E2G1_9TELE|nr:hypothetical protein EYF80_066961 [Liparis tanakae]